ncbi:MAG: MFS transporter [Chloroflexi bacterium]|nr:MFS transporter [Chloroflexota bacterium]
MRTVLFTLFLDVLAYSMIAPLLPFYVHDLAGAGAGVPVAWLAGMLGAGYAAMQLISGPLLGVLSDRHGRRPVLLACQVGTVISFVLLANAMSIEMLFVAVLVDGLTGGNLTAVHAYIADVSTPEKRAHNLALTGVAFGLGVTTGPALGSLLAMVNLHAAVVACIVAAASLILTASFLPESLPAEQRTVRSSGSLPHQLPHQLPRRLSSRLSHRPAITLLLTAIFAANLSFVGLQANFGLFSAARFAWSMRETSGFFAFVGLCAVLTQGLVLPIAQRRFGDRRLIAAGLPLLALGLAGIAFASDARWVFPAAAIAAFGSGLSLPTLSAVAAHTAAEQRGLLMGATQSLHAIASIAAPLMTGAAYEFVAPGAPYLAGCACALIAAGAAHRAFVMLQARQ